MKKIIQIETGLTHIATLLQFFKVTESPAYVSNFHKHILFLLINTAKYIVYN